MRELISADLDGEATPAQAQAVDAHLATCAQCSAWREKAQDAGRKVLVSGATPPPDVSGVVIARLAEQRPGGVLRGAVARTALVSLALVQLFWSSLSVIANDGHLGRDVWAFDIALALAVLAVARRPWRAAGLFPMLAGLSVLLAVTVSSDLVRGVTSIGQELPHLIVIVEFLVIWRLRNDPGPLGSLPPAPSGVDAPTVRRIA